LDAALVLTGRAKGDLIANAIQDSTGQWRLMISAKNGTNTDVIFLDAADAGTKTGLKLDRGVSAVRIEAGNWNPVTSVQEALWKVFGAGGIFGAEGVVFDENGDGQKTIEDIQIKSDDRISDERPCGLFATYCQFNVHLKQALVDAAADLSFDIGVPGFGLAADGKIRFELAWEMYLNFGISNSVLFYLDTSPAEELAIFMRVTLPGSEPGKRFTVKGSLAFLQATIVNGVDVNGDGAIANAANCTKTNTCEESMIEARIGLNIKDPDKTNPDNRFSIADILGQDALISDAPARPTVFSFGGTSPPASTVNSVSGTAVGPNSAAVAKNSNAEKSRLDKLGDMLMSMFEITFSVSAEVHLDMTLGVPDEWNGSAFPSFGAEFHLSWGLSQTFPKASTSSGTGTLYNATTNPTGYKSLETMAREALVKVGNTTPTAQQITEWIDKKLKPANEEYFATNPTIITCVVGSTGPAGCIAGQRFLPENTKLYLPQSGIPKPTILIKNIGVNLGSFLSKVLAPVVEVVQEILAPVGFLIDPDDGFLYQEIDLISWLMGKPMKVLDVIDLFMVGKYKQIRPFIDAASKIYGIIKNMPTNGDDIKIPLIGCIAILGPDQNGDGVFDDVDKKKLCGGGNGLNTQSVGEKILAEAQSLGQSQQQADTAARFTNSLSTNVGTGTQQFQFGIPIITDPSQLLNLLQGKVANLVHIDLPKFQVGVTWRMNFQIWAAPPITAYVEASFNFSVDLAFGYDTQGILDMQESGDFLDIFNGFYISDRKNPDGTGPDVPEFVVSAKLAAGASLGIGGLLTISAGGGIIATIEADLFDPNDDGKIRIHELVDTIIDGVDEYGAIGAFAFVDIYGKLEWFLTLSVELLGAKVVNLMLGPFIIVEFSTEWDRPPFLAGFKGPEDDGILQLYAGPLAEMRLNRNIEDGDEVFTITGNKSAVEITAFRKTRTYKDVNYIIANMGEGNDTLDARGLSGVILVAHGDDGNDTIYGTSAGEYIYGDAGDDRLYGMGGDDVLIGGKGNNWLYGGSGNDILLGDKGKDVLDGGSGNDRLIGQKGDDAYYGGEGDDEYVFRSGMGLDSVSDTSGNDTINMTAVSSKVVGTIGTFANPSYAEFTSSRNSITFNAFEIENIYSGRGSDIFTIYSTAELNIDGGDGSDKFIFTGGLGIVNVNDTGTEYYKDRVIIQGTLLDDNLTLHDGGFKFNTDRGNGVTFTQRGRYGGNSGLELYEVKLFGGDDTLYLAGVDAGLPVKIDLGDGDDKLYAGMEFHPLDDEVDFDGPGAPNCAIEADIKCLNRIQDKVTVKAGEGTDLLHATELRDIYANTGSLEAYYNTRYGAIFGLGMSANGLFYNGIETLQIQMGSGNNVFTIVNTKEDTTIWGGSGAELFTFKGTASTTLLNSGAGADTILVENTGGETTVVAGTNTDSIILEMTTGTTTLHGDDPGIHDQGSPDNITVNGTGGTTFVYGGIEADTIIINGTGGTTTIGGQGGDDNVMINDTGGTTFVDGDEGIDTFLINGTNGATTINGGTSLDYFTFVGANGITIINGDRPTDNVDNRLADEFVGNGFLPIFTPAPIPAADPRQDILVWIDGAEVVQSDNYMWDGTDIVFTDSYGAPAAGARVQVTRICNPNNHPVVGCPGDDRFYIQSGGGDLTINGGWGADKYFVSTGVSKATFTGPGGYSDDFPLPSMVGDLTGITGDFTINGWADGNGGLTDRLYISDLVSTADSTGALGTVLTGLSLPQGVSLGYVDVEVLELQLGDGHNTLAVDALPSYTWATIYSGAGDDSLNVGGTNGTLDDIDGVLVYYGGTGTDTLNAYANSETEDNVGQLTAINLTGLGMGTNSWLNVHMQQDAMLSVPAGHTPCTEDASCDAAIYYGERNDADVVSSDVEAVNVFMGSGDDTLRVDGTYAQGVTSIYGGAGDDRFEIESTPWGLHANSLRRVDYVAGPLNVYGEAGAADYVIMNDSGNAVANIGYFEGRTLTGLDMAGSITFDTAEKLEISLGAQNDTFYLRSAPAGVETRVKAGGGFDTVYVGSAAGTLDDIQGSLVIEGNGDFAGDALIINDTGYNGGRTFTVTNDPAAFTLTLLDTGEEWVMDETTITLNDGGQIKYQTMETVAINAGTGNDTLNLEAPHNDRDPKGGFNATFTFNGGEGDDYVNVGQAVTGGRSLDLVDIFSIFNGQDGNDTILFEHTASLVANTLAFVGKTFTQLFPVQTRDWGDIFAAIFSEDAADLIATALFTTVALGVVADPSARVMHMGAHTRNFEHLMFSFGAGNDVFQLDDGTSNDPVIYREALTVNGGAGADTFNVSTSYVTTQGMVALNGGLGDDLAYIDYLLGGPNSTLSVTYNGGEHETDGDTLRFSGDGILSGVYNVSPTQARSGSVSVSGSSFAFTGVEPLVVNGFSDLEMIGAENITDLAIESIPVDDMDLTNLVLHVLLVDGVISWRQQVKLDGIGAKETNAFGQALSWDNNTLVVGARRSLVSITNEQPVTQTVVDFIKADKIAAGYLRLASGIYYVEMRDAGNEDWEFRLLDASSAEVHVADVTGGPALKTGWQDVPDNKVHDTERGLLIAFGPVEYNYAAVSGGGAASFNYSVGVYPGVVYIYREIGGTWSEEAKLYADDDTYAAQGFGDSVSLSGETLVVGAPQDISLGSNAGAAYVFQRSGTDWWQAAKLKANDGAVNDRFGSSVATNGSTAIVGAPGDDSNKGAVYAYEFSGGSWVQAAKLTTGDGGDLFGTAIDYRGTTLVVGAPGDEGSRGSAYVYAGSGASWSGPQKLISSTEQAGEQFGTDVAIDTFIVVGAPGYDYDQKIYDPQGLCTRGCDSGVAFVFTGSGTSWSLSARLTAVGGLPANLAQNEGRAWDHFGAAVTTSGEYVVVGAPNYDDVSINQGAIYFFRYLPDQGSGAGYSWIRSKNKLVSNTPTENDYFGQELALSGLKLAVGVPGFNETDANNNILRENVGTVRFFETNGVISLYNANDTTIGLYRAEVTGVSGGSAQAGFEMMYHTASRTLFVGAPGDGLVYVYKDEGLYWRYEYALGWGDVSRYGHDIDIYGNTLVIGIPGSNAIGIFTYSGGSWSWVKDIAGPAGSSGFGTSVAIEGGRIAVGAPATSVCYSSAGSKLPNYCVNLAVSGAVFTYTHNGISWNDIAERFIMPYEPGLPNDDYWTRTDLNLNGHEFARVCDDDHLHNDGPQSCQKVEGTWQTWPGTYLGGDIRDDIYVIYIGPKTRVEVIEWVIGGNPMYQSRDTMTNDNFYGEYHWYYRSTKDDYIRLHSAPNNILYSYHGNGFSGLDDAQFGAAVELVGDSIYIGAPGKHRLYSMNIATTGAYPHWNTIFGMPTLPTINPGTYKNIHEVFYNGGIDWSSYESVFAISPNHNRYMVGYPGADVDVGGGGDPVDTGYTALYIYGVYNGHAANLTSGDNSVKNVGHGSTFASETHFVIGTNNGNLLYNYRQYGPVWNYTGYLLPEPLPTAKFGSSVDIDYMTAVVGARDHDDRGAAFVFLRDDVDSETWTLQASLTGLDTKIGDQFGTAVSIHGDTLVVGAANADSAIEDSGAAYVFNRLGTDWIQQAKLTAPDAAVGHQFGQTAALSVDTIAIGAPAHDSVYVYTRSGFDWSLEQEFNFRNAYGSSLSINAQADMLIVGAPGENSDTGAALIYHRSDAPVPWTHVDTLSAADGAPGDRFGCSVALDGPRAAVGAPGHNGARGAVYAFYYDNAWNSDEKLSLATSAPGDNYGNSVSISGERMVVGAYLRDVQRTSGGQTKDYEDEGSAYAYGIHEGNWRLETVVEPLQASDGYSGDMMGYQVAIDGTLVLSGAPQFDGRIGGLPTNGGGYIYITEISPPLTVTHPEAVQSVLAGANAQAISDTADQMADLYLFDVPSFTLDTSPGNKNDTITISQDGLSAYALSTFIVETGAGNDTLNILSDNLRLPTYGKVQATSDLFARNNGEPLTGEEAAQLYDTLPNLFRYDGGAGSDKLDIPAADNDFDLSDVRLVDGTGGILRLNSVDDVSLVGGPSVNTFTVYNWSGKVTLDGLGGSDRYAIGVGSVSGLNLADTGNDPLDEDRLIALATDGNDNITVTVTEVIVGGQSLAYNGPTIEVLTVGGLDGDDTFYVADVGVPEVTFDGGHGNDAYNLDLAASNANFYVSDSAYFDTDHLKILGGDTTDDLITVGDAQTTVNNATIKYNEFIEQFTVDGQGGDDRIVITGHLPVATPFYGGSGADFFEVQRVRTQGVTLDGQDGDDTYYLVNPAGLAGPVAISDTGTGVGDLDYLLTFGTAGVDTVGFTGTTITGLPLSPTALQGYSGLEGIKIDLLGGNDVVTINGTPAGLALYLSGNEGNDSFSVSNFSSFSNHPMRLNGEEGQDSLILDAAAGSTGTLAETSFSGFGLPQPIEYGTFENLSLNLGSGSDILTVDGWTAPSSLDLRVSSAAGNDVLNIINSPLDLSGGHFAKGGSGRLNLTGENAYAGQSTVEGGTLLVNIALIPVKGMTVAAGSTLSGTGTVGGSLTYLGAGSLIPGMVPDIGLPGRMVIEGDLNFAPGTQFNVDLNGIIPMTQHDQVKVTGAGRVINLNNATLNAVLHYLPDPSHAFVIIDNFDPSSTVVGTFAGMPDGTRFDINGTEVFITYFGGDGNDVELLLADTLVTLDPATGDLHVTDIGGANGDTEDTLRIQSDVVKGHYIIHDPNNVVVPKAIPAALRPNKNTTIVPFDLVTGTKIIFYVLNEPDHLIIDFSLGDFSKEIHYLGDNPTQPSGDRLTLEGGPTYPNVTYNFSNASNGSIDITDNETITFTGLEPIVDDLSVENRVFTYNGGSETITLSDDDTPINDVSKIDSTKAEVVSFKNPTLSLRVNAGDGDDTLNVRGLDSAYSASLNLYGDTDQDTANFPNLLPSLASLMVDVEAIDIDNGALTTTDTQTYTGPMTLGANTIFTGSLVTFNDTIAAGGNSLTIRGNADFDGAVSGLSTALVTGTTQLDGGSVTSSGAQTYRGAVTQSVGITLTGFLITFNDSITGDSTSLGINGNADFDGPISDLQSLSVTGTTQMDGGAITSIGLQAYQGAVTLGADNTLTGSAVTFESTSDGAQALTIVMDGLTTFNDEVGGTIPLASLTITTGGPFTANHDISTIGDIDITVNDTANTGDDLTVSSGVTVQSTAEALAFNVGDDITIPTDATVQAHKMVTFNADPNIGDPDEFGTMVTIAGVVAGSMVGLNGGDDSDTFSIQRIAAPSVLNAGLDADTINISSDAPANLGILDNITDILTVNGDDGTDILNISDAGDSTGDTGGILTSIQLTGLGGATITYATIETLNIDLGAGDDTFTIQSTSSITTTTLDANAGVDTVNVRSTAVGSVTTINGDDGDDIVKVGNIGDSLDEILGVLFVNGNDPTASDVLNINDLGDTDANLYTLSGSTLDRTGMAQLTYGTMEELNLNAGLGDDTVVISDTHEDTTTINSNDGNDMVLVQTTSGETTLSGQAGDDQIIIQTTGDRLNTVVNGGEGQDSITVQTTGIDSTTTLNGDAGRDTLNLQATGLGAVTTLNGGDDADTINVQTIAGVTKVNAGAGSDSINVSSDAPANRGTLNGISADLQVKGEDGNDTLNISDVGDTSNNTGELTGSKLTGLGMAVGITYVTFESLNITLGSGDDQISIRSTHAPAGTNVNAGPGDDSYLIFEGWGILLVTEKSSNGEDTLNFTPVVSNLGFAISSYVFVSDSTNTLLHLDNVIEHLIGGSGDDWFDMIGTDTQLARGRGTITGGLGYDTISYENYKCNNGGNRLFNGLGLAGPADVENVVFPPSPPQASDALLQLLGYFGDQGSLDDLIDLIKDDPGTHRLGSGSTVSLNVGVPTSILTPNNNLVVLSGGIGGVVTVNDILVGDMSNGQEIGSGNRYLGKNGQFSTFGLDAKCVKGLAINLFGANGSSGSLPVGESMAFIFQVPTEMLGKNLAIMWWDEDRGMWREVPCMITPDGRCIAITGLTGTFALVSK